VVGQQLHTAACEGVDRPKEAPQKLYSFSPKVCLQPIQIGMASNNPSESRRTSSPGRPRISSVLMPATMARGLPDRVPACAGGGGQNGQG